MKIGILTQPLRNNYGGLLQNYALQQTLIRLGHEPITFDWRPPRASKQRILCAYVKVFFRRLLSGRKDISYPYYQPTEEENSLISQNNKKFIDTYITHSDVINNSQGFGDEVSIQGVKALIVGSDQVWRPCYNGKFLYDMFFRFAKRKPIKRIAYAVSFGTSKWEFSKYETAVCKRLVKNFDLITVREESGIELCKRYLEVQAKHVLDPTLLLNKKDYQKLIPNDRTRKGTLFYYILDPSDAKINFIESYSLKNGFIPFTHMPKYPAESISKLLMTTQIEDCVYPSVLDWLKAYDDAEYIICDSFHGCVFAIIFNKPFWVIANKERGLTRFESLLKLFCLENRLLDINSEDINRLDMSSLNWEKINRIKQDLANISIQFLEKSL